jgi:hypothetical protein
MTGLETVLSLAQVARRLDRAGITWAVFAGAAANIYGSTRPLTDVDILVPLAEGNRVAAMFPGAHTVRQEDGTVRSIKLPGFDLVAGLTMFDASAAYDVDPDEQMAARRTYHEIDGVTVPVIPPRTTSCSRRSGTAGRRKASMTGRMCWLCSVAFRCWTGITCVGGPVRADLQNGCKRR